MPERNISIRNSRGQPLAARNVARLANARTIRLTADNGRFISGRNTARRAKRAARRAGLSVKGGQG